MSVLLFGPSRAGKTTLAVALLRALLEAKVAAHPFANDNDVNAVARQCRFIPARRLGVAGTVPGDPLEIRRAMRAPVLLLDDLGKDADIKSNPVPAIIAERHDDELSTWITTELSPIQISERYGEGIARRICENAWVLRFVRT
jgi:DNA replication protein DnaC